MNVDRMRRYVHNGDEAAIEKSALLASFHRAVGRKTMTRAQRRHHASLVRGLAQAWTGQTRRRDDLLD